MRVKTSPCSRKATVLMVKHRAANLTYRSALTRFGHTPLWKPWYLSEPACMSFICLMILLLCDVIIVHCVKYIYISDFYILKFQTTKENFSFFNFSKNLAKIEVGSKYTLALLPKFKWGHGPLATHHSSTNYLMGKIYFPRNFRNFQIITTK